MGCREGQRKSLIYMKISDSIYLDHQASTPVAPQVQAEMLPFWAESCGNPHSSDHALGWEAARAVETAASRVAGLLGADPDEVIFTSGATESNNLALLGLGRGAAEGNGGGKDGRHRVLLSAIEHKCVLAAGQALQYEYGREIEIGQIFPEIGLLDLDRLEQALGEDVLLVSVMAVNNEVGTIQDVAEISRLVRGCGAVFHCDAAQAPMAMDIGSLAEHADIISLSGHKMYGPKGIGVACISRDIQQRVKPLIHGGGQQNGLRSGTLPTALCVGMGAAADMFAAADIGEKRESLRRRRDDFVARLQGFKWPVAVNGPAGQARHPGNANLRFSGFSAQDILSALQPRLAASTGSACTTGIPEPSHVLRAIGLDGESADASIRFSLGFDTSDEDVEEAAGLIAEALDRLA